MAGHGEKITLKQERVIAALLTAGSMREAAEEAKISPTTLSRWLKDEQFVRAYRAARRRIVEHALAELQAAAKEAVATLCRNMASGVPHVEVSAARAVLSNAMNAVELVDLQERLERLEHADAGGTSQ
ncbi:MAG: hypothetical protein AAF654_03625 [Myxococcota bacterium]